LFLSGYNITLLAASRHSFEAVPFRLADGADFPCGHFVVLISGSGVASIRAGIMAAIALAAGLSVRTYQPLRALTIAYLVFFFLTPATIFADPGFHLSFLATGFMILVLPRIQRLFPRHDRSCGTVREILLLACMVPISCCRTRCIFPASFARVAVCQHCPCDRHAVSHGARMLLLATSWIAPLAGILGAIISAIGTVVVDCFSGALTCPHGKRRTSVVERCGVYVLLIGILLSASLVLMDGSFEFASACAQFILMKEVGDVLLLAGRE